MGTGSSAGDGPSGAVGRGEVYWRSGKWEEVYLHEYQTVADALSGLGRSFRFSPHDRPHQALSYQTPAQVFGVAS